MANELAIGNLHISWLAIGSVALWLCLGIAAYGMTAENRDDNGALDAPLKYLSTHWLAAVLLGPIGVCLSLVSAASYVRRYRRQR